MKVSAIIDGPEGKELFIHWDGNSTRIDYNNFLYQCHQHDIVYGTIGTNVLLDKKDILTEKEFINYINEDPKILDILKKML